MSRLSIISGILTAILGCASLSGSVVAQDAAASSDSPKHLTIVFGGAIDSQIASRVTEFIQQQLMIDLAVAQPLSDLKDGFDALARELANSVDTSTDFCLLAVVASQWKLKQQGAIYEPLRVGIVDLNALVVSSDDEVPFSKKEQVERRAEKEALRAVALLCGLKPCPFPQCCLYEHRNEQDLDRKSRNLCPPCRSKAMDALRKASVPVADKDVSGSK